MTLYFRRIRFFVLLSGIAFLLFSPNIFLNAAAADNAASPQFQQDQNNDPVGISIPLPLENGISQVGEVQANANLRYTFIESWGNISSVYPTTPGNVYHDIAAADPLGTTVKYVAVKPLDPGASCHITNASLRVACYLNSIPVGGQIRLRFTVEYDPIAISFSTTLTNFAAQVFGPYLHNLAVQVNQIAFEEHLYPDVASWSLLPEPGAKTVEGNIIRITAEIQNFSSVARNVIVHFTDVNGNIVLNSTAYSFDPWQLRDDIRFEWDTSGYAWSKSGGADSDRQIRVSVSISGEEVNNKTQDITVQPRPIILVRGLGAATDGSITKLKPFLLANHDGWTGRIYEAGDGTVPGMIDMGDSPASSASTGKNIAWNAAQLEGYIEGIRQQENAWQVEVIAHSTGSLAVRQYIQTYLPDEAALPNKPPVRNAVLIGGPNLGSLLANHLVDGYIWKQRLLGDAIGYGTAWDARTNWVTSIFNPRVTNTNGVQYIVISGDTDEVVGYQSGLGQLDSGALISNFASAKLYRVMNCGDDCHGGTLLNEPVYNSAIRPNLISNPGGFHTNTANALIPQETEIVIGSRDAFTAELAQSNTPQAVIGVSDLLLAPSTSVNSDFMVPTAARMGITQYVEAGLSYSVFDPNGIEQHNRAPSAEGSLRDPSFNNPVAGLWEIQYTNTSANPISVEYIVWVEGNPLTFGLSASQNQGFMTITGRFLNGNAPITGATISADLIDSNGLNLNTYTLLDDGLHGDNLPNDGVYALRIGGLTGGDYSIAGSAKKGSDMRVDNAVITMPEQGSADAPMRNFFITPDISLTWNSLNTAASYQIEVDDSGDFSAPLIYGETVPSSQLAVSFTVPGDGIYYWRVRALYANGSMSSWSDVETFTVDLP